MTQKSCSAVYLSKKSHSGRKRAYKLSVTVMAENWRRPGCPSLRLDSFCTSCLWAIEKWPGCICSNMKRYLKQSCVNKSKQNNEIYSYHIIQLVCTQIAFEQKSTFHRLVAKGVGSVIKKIRLFLKEEQVSSCCRLTVEKSRFMFQWLKSSLGKVLTWGLWSSENNVHKNTQRRYQLAKLLTTKSTREPRTQSDLL